MGPTVKLCTASESTQGHPQPAPERPEVPTITQFLGYLGSVLECVDSPVDKFTDHHECSSCLSHILWHEVPEPWHRAGQVTERESLKVQPVDAGSSSSFQEEQAIRGAVQTLDPFQPCRHWDLPEQPGVSQVSRTVQSE